MPCCATLSAATPYAIDAAASLTADVLPLRVIDAAPRRRYATLLDDATPDICRLPADARAMRAMFYATACHAATPLRRFVAKRLPLGALPRLRRYYAYFLLFSSYALLRQRLMFDSCISLRL